jgi:hypothetical protein
VIIVPVYIITISYYLASTIHQIYTDRIDIGNEK